MKYSFDEIIERRGTDAYKYMNLKMVCGRDDVLPMWVADMDFATPPFVMNAIQKRCDQRVLGYTCSTDRYRASIVGWCKSHYGWEVLPEHITYIPGVVAGIYLAMQAFTEKGDKILIQDPVYHPFRIVPEGNGRQIVWNRLVRNEETFGMDLDALRKDIKGCKMMILCNPHNPAGVCWSRETLEQVAHICSEEGVIVVSDEIHCDMIFGERRHIPFASVSDEAKAITITLQAPSKTFNMPGIVCSQAIVPDDTLREKYFDYIERSDMGLGNVFTFSCAEACYSDEGDEWRRQMLEYVNGNIDAFQAGLAAITDKVSIIRPQASFLVFMDCRPLMAELAAGKSDDEAQECLIRFFADKCGLGFNPGNMFGQNGTGYMRVNMGCPRSTIEEALKRIAQGFTTL